MHKSQIFFWLLVSFLAGIFIASFLSVGQTFVYSGLIATVGLIGVFGYNKRFNPAPILSADHHSERRRDWSGAGGKLLLVGFFGVAFLFGVVRFNSADFGRDRLNVFTDLKAGEKDIEVVVNGYIDDEPVDRGGRQELVLKAKELVAGDKTVPLNDRILLTVNNFPKFNYGDVVSAKGALQKPQNFGEFDYITYLKRQNIRTTMFYPEISSLDEHHDSFLPVPALPARLPRLPAGRPDGQAGRRQAGIYHNMGFFEKVKMGLYKKIFGLKNKFESAINKSIAEPNASFINGILLGSRQNIPEEMKEAFNKTGTTHILAISGYNIMIISWAVLAGLVYFFKRRTAFWLSVAIIILFTILTGASSSVVRASIMGLLLLFANGYGRLYDPKNSIILAGAAMIWLNPFALVFDIGFQLSFLAVMGLLYIYPFLDNMSRKVPELWKLKELTLMTISAQLAVAPLLIYYFHQFSPFSLPANILILPFVPFAMLIGFISGIGGMIFLPLGKIIGFTAWAITAYQIEIIKILSGF